MLLMRGMAKSPLSSSWEIVTAARVRPRCKTTRCKVLKELGSVKKAHCRPRMTSQQEAKRLRWARDNMKRDFSKFIWMDEARATLDDPYGSWQQDGS